MRHNQNQPKHSFIQRKKDLFNKEIGAEIKEYLVQKLPSIK